MELDRLGEAFEKSVSIKDMPSTVLAQDIRLILYLCVKLQVLVAESNGHFNYIAGHLRLWHGRVRHKKESCRVRVITLLYELIWKYFRYTAAGHKLFELHRDFLQGKYDAVEKLWKNQRWIGKSLMKELKKQEEKDLKEAHEENEYRRKFTRCETLKFRNYFV
ncbi:hypothetical protein MKW94_017772 [Papaver nudicaule]|uniref:Uncharacterized protein n=1 Tax=Papaver nudicaule TaxID=74823 RepID=A0AA41VCD4_PAPNU|nr:hypothetical protein [Papaver nudicaule]